MRIALSMLAGIALSGALFGLMLAGATGTPEHSYAKYDATGTYVCAQCGRQLFESSAKFASTTRWPSFRAAVDAAVATRPDHSYGLDRTEVVCAQCGLHLGHVFPDGRLTGDTSPDAGTRFCILSSSLAFRPAPAD